LSVLDYGDKIYMHVPLNTLKKLDAVYHAALRFMTGSSVCTHHCNFLIDKLDFTEFEEEISYVNLYIKSFTGLITIVYIKFIDLLY